MKSRLISCLAVHDDACNINKLLKNWNFETIKIPFIQRAKYLHFTMIVKLYIKLYVKAIFSVIQGHYDIISRLHFDVDKEIWFGGNGIFKCTQKTLSVEANINKVWTLLQNDCYCRDLMLQHLFLFNGFTSFPLKMPLNLSKPGCPVTLPSNSVHVAGWQCTIINQVLVQPG